MLPAVGTTYDGLTSEQQREALDSLPLGTRVRYGSDECEIVSRSYSMRLRKLNGQRQSEYRSTLTVISYPPGTVHAGSLPPVGTTLQQPEAYEMLAKLPVGTKVRYMDREFSVVPKWDYDRDTPAYLSGCFIGNSKTSGITILSYPSTQPESYKVYCSWLCSPWDCDPGSPTQQDAVRWWQTKMKPYLNWNVYRPGGDPFQSSYLIDSAGKRVASLPEVYARVYPTPEKQPMKIEVFTTPEPNTPEPLRLKLEQNGEDVIVNAVDADGKLIQSLCTFKSDGTLSRHAFFGLSQVKRDTNGRIAVAQ